MRPAWERLITIVGSMKAFRFKIKKFFFQYKDYDYPSEGSEDLAKGGMKDVKLEKWITERNK